MSSSTWAPEAKTRAEKEKLTITIDLTSPTTWPTLPCPEGLAAAQAWAVERGYPLDAVPVTKETVQSAGEAGVEVWWAAYLLDRTTAIEVGLGYWYARNVDHVPRNDTREAAITEGNGCRYAQWIDRVPRDDTRTAAVKEGKGYLYARWVDQAARDDTRAAAIKEGWGYGYARFIDQGARDDTREAAIAEGYDYFYEVHVPGA